MAPSNAGSQQTSTRQPTRGSAADASRQATDAFGRPFSLPVDAEHKATVLRIGSFANPHMRAFHVSWLGFFVTFFSTFAAAPLLPSIKRDLGLTKTQTAAAAMGSVGSTVLFRLVMGYVCDVVGARRGLAFLLLLTAPPLVAMSFVTGATGFIVCRSLIGTGLASFVACQAWVSVMFSPPIVGLANATAAGWGNLGGGVVTLLMPLLLIGATAVLGDEERGWRACFALPALLHVALGLLTLRARDLPDGNFEELEAAGAKQSSDGGVVLRVGMTNLNGWLLAILYAASFGVELTVTNEAVLYFSSYHGLGLAAAGALASSFGLMNLFARALGGYLSDAASARFGTRGRLWALYLALLAEGATCVALGRITAGMPLSEIAASGTAGRCALTLALFSVFVQLAEGGTYAIVPQLARAALGVVSGLVGAGGNVGAVLAEFCFFSREDARTDEGFVWMGYAVIGLATLCAPLLYFPEAGGLLCGARPKWLAWYDPQILKPPRGYRAADAIEYGRAARPRARDML